MEGDLQKTGSGVGCRIVFPSRYFEESGSMHLPLFPGFLSGNQLKILALLAMTCDHAGLLLLPQYPILRGIGRLAFPIFAWFIAEGCRYTKNRGRYFSMIAVLALFCQAVSFLYAGSLYQTILVTFSISILWIFAVDRAQRIGTWGAWWIAGSVGGVSFFLSEILPLWVRGSGFAIDYGFWGIFFPLAVWLAEGYWSRLAAAALVLAVLSLSDGVLIQWFSLFALFPLALYNGQRGTWNLKYLFYIYYPLHLVVLHLLK